MKASTGIERRAGAIRSRNSAPGGIRPIAASGASANTSTVSNPLSAATASGPGYSPSRNDVGSSPVSAGATAAGASAPSASPATMPASASAMICSR